MGRRNMRLLNFEKMTKSTPSPRPQPPPEPEVMPQLPSPSLRHLLPLSQTLVSPGPLLHLSRPVFYSTSISVDRAPHGCLFLRTAEAGLRALAYRCQASGRRGNPYHLLRRGNSTLGKKSTDMGVGGGGGAGDVEVVFNKTRAEGKDDRKGRSMELKSRKLNPINTICYVQILGTGMDTQDTSPSILLFFDKQRFIFNAGEGLQRFCTEHKIKLSKIDHIFLTRVCSETAGGLPGAGANSGRIGEEGMSPGGYCYNYACELPELKGKFDPAKAAALGLKPGPKYRELQLGKSVQSDAFDKMVHPSDVLGLSIPGPIVLLVDCPTKYHMHELFSLQALTHFYEDSSRQAAGSSKKVNCVIHLGPSFVTKSLDYQNWMRRFGATQHIMAGHEIKNMENPILKGSARISSRLHFVCPHLFPSSGFWPVEPVNDVNLENKNSSLQASENVSAANLLKFHLRPYAQLGLDRASIPNLSTYGDIVDELLSEIPEIKEVPEQISKFWQNEKSKSGKLQDGTPLRGSGWRKHPKGNTDMPCCVENATREDMEITFLGTGSSQPSNIGMFGISGADEVVKSLKCIWISHIHADHHTGVARVLALRSKLLEEFLDCRHTLKSSIEAFLSDSATESATSQLENTIFAPGSRMENYSRKSLSSRDISALVKLKEVLHESGLEVLYSVPVVHCPLAFGVVLRAKEKVNSAGKAIPGWKVVYSGDTRPCPALVDASRAATVLIHEVR
ncbi:hypothetical protein GUJ93_ZPchr0001g32916 [Zizania palustris]|uniref:tRNase Z endonuclease domain-containing protein n=1 Tax=Zizania palustris TaxID=103762 RepID=A0A8J5RRD3_ZIZPA|nr:hypothetical protein GUJ93_ZPchr0001g32916 [Zizania palustris]